MKIKLNKIKKRLDELDIGYYVETRDTDEYLVVTLSLIRLDIYVINRTIYVDIWNSVEDLVDSHYESTQKDMLEWLVKEQYLWQK